MATLGLQSPMDPLPGLPGYRGQEYVPWEFWHPDVMVHVPGASFPLVNQALCRAAREFCRRTRVWMVWLTPSVTSARLGFEYEFDLPMWSEVLRAERATLNGAPLPVDSYRTIPMDWTRYPNATQGMVTVDWETFNLSGTFNQGDDVQAQVSLMPTVRSPVFPRYLAERYLEIITEGAKSILFLTPDQPFYKPDLAAVSKQAYMAAIDEASLDISNGSTNKYPRANVLWR